MDRSVRRGLIVILIALAAIVVMMVAPGHKKIHPPNDDPWVLVSYDPDNPVGTYLGNGFISTRIMGDGVGSQTRTMPDGSFRTDPLPCFMAGLYDDEKLSPIPTWSDLRIYDARIVPRNVQGRPGGRVTFTFGEDQFKLDRDADYKQTLDLRTGILTTEATWRLGRKSLRGKVEVLVSRAQPGTGIVRMQVTPDFDGQVVPQASLGNTEPWHQHLQKEDGNAVAFSVGRTGFLGMAAGVLAGKDWIPAFVLSAHGAPISPGVRVVRDKPAWFTLFASVALAKDARSAMEHARGAAFWTAHGDADPVAAHKAAWSKLWQHDIKIDGPKKDQQAIHSCMFYLLQSVREGSQWSIPPMGLSNNSFSGHVFWDADTWMLPALILQHPELAKSIVDYRYNTLKGAMANAKASGCAGAEYAWESGYTGKEDTPPGLVYRNERHINGDVALAQWQYYLATADLAWLRTRGLPVIRETADYWVSRVSKSSKTGRYELKQVVGPDENAETVDNSAYTNAIARTNLLIAARAAQISGVQPNPKWTEIANKFYIPFDDKVKRFVPFDGYKGWKAKQADVELLAYPLQFQLPGYVMPLIDMNTYEFYAPKVMPNGPAMTSSAHSVIAARLGFEEEAYARFKQSYKPFLRGPFNYFNEKQSKTWDNMCFLTGAAGPIQAAVFGLAGAHMDYFPQDPATAELSFRPCLPKQWKSIKITGIQWHGKTFDMTVSKGNKVAITPM